MVKKMWEEVQNNLGRFQKLFGAENMLIVDNSSYDNGSILDQAEKAINKKLRDTVKNPLGKRWLHDNSPAMAAKNRPM